MRVLISAYACEPDIGSEQEVGWKWAQEMSRVCDVTVITRANSRALIDPWMKEYPGDMRARFLFLECGPVALCLKKAIPGGLYLYYFLWQRKLRRLTKELLKHEAYDLVHHVTFASFRMPVGVQGTPLVWGPVGGAECAPPALLSGHGFILGRTRERFRNLSTHVVSKLLFLWSPIKNGAGIALASTPATLKVFQDNDIPCELMPAIGYDSPETTLPARESASDELRLLYVGRLHLLKGLHLLIQAIFLLDKQPLRLTIVGTGPDRLNLENLVSSLKINDRVTFHGHIHHTQLDEVFARHDILTAPSLYESGGLSILEGFSHGLPAIVLDCGGPALSVTEECGIKIPSYLGQQETVRRLAAAIEVYLGNPELVTSHGANARKRVAEEYGWDHKRERMLNIYKRLLRGEYTN